jgi:hypothetical protein
MSSNNKPPANNKAASPNNVSSASNASNASNTRKSKNNNNNNNNNNKSKAPSAAIAAPTLANTSKQSISKNNAAATAATAASGNTGNTIQTIQEEATGLYEVAADNYIILLAVVSAIVIITIIYFFSQTFRVGRTISHMQTYQGYQKLASMDYKNYGTTRLGDYHIASTYNAAHAGYQMYDYTSEYIVLAALQGGARYLEFNVFNSEYGASAYPVASMGYKEGEWKMMINDTPMETIFEIIAKNAFKIYDGAEGAFNPDDPVFIGLNLNTNSNISCLNLLAFLITKYFGDRLLPNAYSFQSSDAIADMPLSQLIGKVVIFSSDGFQGSGMEEVVNYCWDNTDSNPNHAMRRYHFADLTKKGFNNQELIDFNRRGLTIVVPHREGDFFNTNYNPVVAKQLGCHCIAMEFQYVDTNMDYYITLFKERAMVMKDDDLLKGQTNATRPMTTTAQLARTTTTSTAATTNPATTIPRRI